MTITALCNTHFDEQTYRAFVFKCNVFPTTVRFRPLVDDKNHHKYDERGAEQMQTVLEFNVDAPQPLTNTLIELGCKILIEGKEYTATPVV